MTGVPSCGPRMRWLKADPSRLSDEVDLVCLSFEFSIATVQVVDNHATRYCHTAQAAA